MAFTPVTPGGVSVHLFGYKTVFDLGYINDMTSGGDVGPGSLRDAIQAGVEAGVNIYLPGGYTYEWNGRVIFDNAKSNITIFGDGRSTHVIETTDKVVETDSIIYIQDGSSGITIRDIWFEGNSNLLIADTSLKYQAIYADRTVNLRVKDCFFNGFGGYVIKANACSGAELLGNYFWDNVGDTTGVGQNDGDIHISLSGVPAGTTGNRTSIVGNQCLSPNRTGIFVSSVCEELVVSDNIVVQLNSDLTEPALNDPANYVRKDGIILIYNPSAIDDSPTKVWSVTCTGNVVRNTIWSGIYLNGNGTWDANLGPRTTISGNSISKACMDISGTVDAWQGGICIRGSRNTAVTGNVIADTNLAGWTDVAQYAFHPAGIHYTGVTGRTGEPESAGCSFTGNVISDTRGPGFYAAGQLDGFTMTGNTFKNFYRGMQVTTSTTEVGTRSCIINNNIFEVANSFFTEADNTLFNRLIFFGADLEESIRSVHFDFSHNHVELRGGVPGVAGVDVQTSNFTFVGNTIAAGNSSLASRAALRVAFSSIMLDISGGQDEEFSGRNTIVIGDNKFSGFNIGIWSATTDPSVSLFDWGIIPDCNSAFNDVPNPYNPAPDHPWGGVIIGGMRSGENVEVWSPSLMTQGYWKRGDRIINSDPVVGQPEQWVCVTSYNSAGGGSQPANWQAIGTL